MLTLQFNIVINSTTLLLSMMKIRYLLSLLPLVLLLFSACNTTSIPRPQTVRYPGDLDDTAAHYALVATYSGGKPRELSNKARVSDEALEAADSAYLRARRAGPGWMIENFTEDTIVFRLHIRSHSLQVTMDFDDDLATLRITDSQNMKQTADSIHRKAPLWVQTLETEIQAILTAVAASR